MRLSNLNENAAFKKCMFSLSPELDQALDEYRATREASGFVRLACSLLLALTSGENDKLESVADALFVSVETLEDLYRLRQEFVTMDHRLGARLTAALDEIQND
jgi:hypothetical protein